MTELQRWKSHKIVEAGKIMAYDEDTITVMADDGFTVEITPKEFTTKYKGGDTDLGYYVRYEDGYESWSPSKAFEEGYTVVESGSISVTLTKDEWTQINECLSSIDFGTEKGEEIIYANFLKQIGITPDTDPGEIKEEDI